MALTNCQDLASLNDNEAALVVLSRRPGSDLAYREQFSSIRFDSTVNR